MAKYLINDQTLTNIADTIREITGESNAISGNDIATNLQTAAASLIKSPTIGLILKDFDNAGYPSTIETQGLTAIPYWYFWGFGQNRYNRTIWHKNITKIILNEGVQTIESSAFREMSTNIIETIIFPSTIISINGSYLFTNTYGVILDFSKCNSIPTLTSITSIGINNNYTIKVKQSLLDEWQTATNWSALETNWQGV